MKERKEKERLTLQDNAISSVMKMAGGNPGAAICLMEVITKAQFIDLDSALGGIGVLLSLDSYEIYGSDIYVLYSDICGKDLAKMLAVLRACQLGLFNHETLQDACSRQDYSGREMIPVEELYEKVKKELPKFNSL